LGRASNSRGQAIPLDFMAGLFIFIVLLSYFMLLWNMFTTQYADHADSGSSETEAIAVAEQLVSSTGTPFNWTLNPLTAQSIGFASRPNQLDPARVAAFGAVPYANAKQLLGIDRDFQVKIETPAGARYATFGQQAGNGTNRSVEVTRIATYNGQAVNVRVQVYD
jgi:hypothetical protein